MYSTTISNTNISDVSMTQPTESTISLLQQRININNSNNKNDTPTKHILPEEKDYHLCVLINHQNFNTHASSSIPMVDSYLENFDYDTDISYTKEVSVDEINEGLQVLSSDEEEDLYSKV